MSKRGLVVLLIVGACASSSGGDDIAETIDARAGTIDAPGGPIDAPGGAIDAPPGTIDGPPASPGIGLACTGEGQGTCPVGFECLNLVGGSGSWCSKRCTGTSDQSCAAGYGGPGYAACLLTVTPAAGGPAVPYCTILCFDAPGAPTYCPGGDPQCNNTCPAPLACTAAIGSPAQARLCQ